MAARILISLGISFGFLISANIADVCDVSTDKLVDCYPGGGSNSQNCQAKGCCWRVPPGENHNLPWCYYPAGKGPSTSVNLNNPKCANITDADRTDCYPDAGSSETLCTGRGCCWKPSSIPGAPWCFYADVASGYSVDSTAADGSSAYLNLIQDSHWPDEIKRLKLDIYKETATRLHFKITDANSKRFEVPIDTPQSSNSAGNTAQYDVQIQKTNFGVVVKRKSTGSVLFDTSVSPLIYADQYIQISSTIPSKYIYGLGEHRGKFWLDPKTTSPMGFWARDVPPKDNTNLYGSHPFFIAVESDGNAYGVFLLNSNGLEIQLMPTDPTTIRYRAIGGILDFYVFTGPTPDEVIQQYLAVIGKPMLPPYWSLGFHNCRWGYNSNAEMRKVIKRLRDNGVPFDTQWNDIDHMIGQKDWTISSDLSELGDIARDLHSHDQKYVMILDPAISSDTPNYPPYDEGIKDDIFIKDASGDVLIGKVWPGLTAFPDFTHPKAQDWWTRQGQRFHSQVPFDGIWIDMNEPSNFVVGSTKGCTNSKLDNPPFTPIIEGRNIKDKTICPSSKQYIGNHYDLHNLYGYYEGIATNGLLKTITKKRPFVLSRSTYASSGKYVAHWEGDNNSDWYDLKVSIPEILNFNMFGIPFVGCDICGFFGTTTDELCTRWFQLGTFYPFMRNHRDNKGPDQDPMAPAFTSETHKNIKNTLLLRYRVLPYLYTLLYNSHNLGQGVARPLFFQYPTDPNTLPIDDQFMWSDGLLISPVVTQGGKEVNAYIPSDRWFDFYDGSEILTTGTRVKLPAPMDKINVHVRGGTILPLQEPDVTTTASRKNNFELIVAPTKTGTASGSLFWDDGDSLDSISSKTYNLIDFKLNGNKLTVKPTKKGYNTKMVLGKVDVFGVSANPLRVLVNGKAMAHSYNAQAKALRVERLSEDLFQPITITWS